jgi:16S rRNA G527 N7-methylase RsmG
LFGPNILVRLRRPLRILDVGTGSGKPPTPLGCSNTS